LEELKST